MVFHALPKRKTAEFILKHLEHDLQCVVIECIDIICRARAPHLLVNGHAPVFAVPNGGHRHIATAAKLKAEGVRRGVPDLIVPIPSTTHCGLVVEMKSPTGRVSKDQQEWLDIMSVYGWRTVVARTHKEAIEAMLEQLGIEVKL
jgi:hypothetical protein